MFVFLIFSMSISEIGCLNGFVYLTFLIFLITFITYWNDYQTPLVYLPSYPTAAYGMLRLSKTIDNFYSSTPMIISGAVVLMVPVLVLFLCFHKRLLGNINIGGIKG